MDIQELIRTGRQKLEAERKAREAEQVERERLLKERKAQEDAESQAGILASLPEAVHPYVEFYPGNSSVVGILIPGCTRIDGHSKENTITVCYVSVPSSIQRSFEESGYEIEYSHHGFKSDELDKALATAADAYPKEQEFLAEIEQREVADAESANATEVADMMDGMLVAAHSEPIDTAEAERERIFALLEQDPIAMDMVRLWVDIAAEREDWQQRLDAADDWISHIQHRHDERIQSANTTAEDAQRETDDVRYRLYQAEDKIADLERELKRGR